MKCFMRFAATALLAAGLSGCFISEQPLVSSPVKLFADGATFSYYLMDSTTNEWPAEATSTGSVKIAEDAYVMTGGAMMGNDSPLVFEMLDPGIYAVQETAKGDDPNEAPVYFYGVIKVEGDTVLDLGFFCGGGTDGKTTNPIFQPLVDSGGLEASEGACKIKDHDTLVAAARALAASNPVVHEKYVFAAGGIMP